MKKTFNYSLIFLVFLLAVYSCRKENEFNLFNTNKPKSGSENFVDTARHYSEIFKLYRENDTIFPNVLFDAERGVELLSLALSYDFMEKGDSTLNFVSRSKHSVSYDVEGNYIHGRDLCETYKAIYEIVSPKVDGKDSAFWNAILNIESNNIEVSLTIIKKMTPNDPSICQDLTPWIEGNVFRGIRRNIVANRICGSNGIDYWMTDQTNNDFNIIFLTGTIDGSPDMNIPNSGYASMIWWMNLDISSGGPGYCWFNHTSGIALPYIDYSIIQTYIERYSELGQQMIDNYYDSNVPSIFKVTDPNFKFYSVEVMKMFGGYINYQQQQTAAYHQLNLYYYHVECTPFER
ncbi:MAG: hypothetical protein MH137_00625 [Flavobacteriales bacterium]|nr:hypothetical protein [Flavobacteriales bacterium]